MDFDVGGEFVGGTTGSCEDRYSELGVEEGGHDGGSEVSSSLFWERRGNCQCEDIEELGKYCYGLERGR